MPRCVKVGFATEGCCKLRYGNVWFGRVHNHKSYLFGMLRCVEFRLGWVGFGKEFHIYLVCSGQVWSG